MGFTIWRGKVVTLSGGSSGRRDPLAEYLATKYDLRTIAPLLAQIKLRVDANGGAFDTDLIDRWLVDAALGVNLQPPPTPKPYRPPVETPRIGEVVYYLLFNGLVKIGTTTDLRQRMRSIPHDKLLGTEPGSYQLEDQRHRQFAGLRYDKEWFWYEGDLIAHVEALPPRR